MASLYNIEQELVNLFVTIEANDGEVTDEQYNSLIIKQEELKDKLESYYHAVLKWETDTECCKAEKKRINDVQNKYKNRIERLKRAIITAVLKFGERSATNNFIELPTFRFSTRNNKSINVDNDRICVLISEFTRFIQELYRNGIIEQAQEPDLVGIVSAINANVQAEYGDDFEPFTVADLIATKVSITTTDTIANLFRNHHYALQELGSDPVTNEIIENTPKEDWKRNIGAATTARKRITVASEVSNVSLIIK